MEREYLKALIDAGRSLIEIGELAGRDPSTVGYWVQKHGLIPNGRDKYAPRGGLTREQLETLADAGLTLQGIASELGRSPSTVRYWLRRFGLQTKRRHRRTEAVAARAAGMNRFTSTCIHHGETEFFVFADGRSCCAKCNSERVSERRRRVKRTLVAEAGGKCTLCGYDRYVGALQFHHLEPSKKEFPVSHKGATIALERARLEAEKCVLLCANCHAEVEGGVASLSAVDIAA